MKHSITAMLCLAATLSMPSPAPAADLVRIKGGTFTMGSPETEAGRGKDEARHSVALNDFYLAPFAVTQKEYRDVMGMDPGHFKGDALPVENVTWYEAVRYCNERSKKEGLTPPYAITTSGDAVTVAWDRNADGYRLPTEAEWEYACRAGTTTPFNTGGNITPEQANYYGHYPYDNAPRGQYREKTLPVGSLAPNAWGLYDMHGNVWEWCWDIYGEYAGDEYAGTDRNNPAGAAEGAFRVNRGGGWNDFGRHLRSAYRAAHNPGNRTFNLGFRVARNAQ